MYGIFINNDNDVLRATSASDRDIFVGRGWRELTPGEITAAGMVGYEQYVSPLTAMVSPDGNVKFTPPDAAEVSAQRLMSLLAAIDADTSAAITAGFEYTVDGVIYHFSYDAFDQQNFADTANVALLAQMGGKGLPESVAWNAYKNWKDGQGDLVRLTFTAESFLALYTGGAVAHKAARMAEGGARKAALAEAVARGATAEELEAI
ncbi:MAG TPA: hypothetical protein VEZ52_09915 [Desulfovibrio sp.]|uniref:DUF4376 domain-containing protein n=1 Tax=Desulfovibrio sp. TaxID=885 RepID=UPI002D38B6D5|nr:hypothetical protein [Desulfovibrio sp.]HZF61922.1 hypothetical protein [Desulfovibrio sp.]